MSWITWQLVYAAVCLLVLLGLVSLRFYPFFVCLSCLFHSLCSVSSFIGIDRNIFFFVCLLGSRAPFSFPVIQSFVCNKV